MNARSEFSTNFAFVLKQDQIRRISRLLGERVGNLAVSAKCADIMVRDFSDGAKVIAYENSASRRIQSMTFNSRSDDGKKEASLSFAEHSWETISASIEGTENFVSRLRDDLLEIIEGTRAWYWRVARVDFFFAPLMLLLIGWSILQVYVNTREQTIAQQSPSFTLTLVAIAVVVIVIAAIAGFFSLMSRLRNRYFPLAVFVIGQEENRFRLDEKIRWTIIVGFVVSLVASAVVATIWSL